MRNAQDLMMQVSVDCAAMAMFRDSTVLQRGVWDSQIPKTVRDRLIAWKYVVVQPYRVFLSDVGLEVAEYDEVVA